MGKTITEDSDWTVYEGARWLRSEARDGYVLGIVRTRHGIVEVESSPPLQGSKVGSTFLCYVMNGREYSRKVRKWYGHRHLVTLAKRFAEEVANRQEAGADA